jgi:predicted acetyltransferase
VFSPGRVAGRESRVARRLARTKTQTHSTYDREKGAPTKYILYGKSRDIITVNNEYTIVTVINTVVRPAWRFFHGGCVEHG